MRGPTPEEIEGAWAEALARCNPYASIVEKARLTRAENTSNAEDEVTGEWGYCGYCRRVEPVDLDGMLVQHEVSRAYREGVMCDGSGERPQPDTPTESKIARDPRCHCPECDPEWSRLEDN